MHLLEEFFKVAKKLNDEHNISPLLYGSLGLEQVTGLSLDPDDIDVLIPIEYLNEKWSNFKSTIESMGFQLINLSEHEFRKGDIKIAFAFVEDLVQFAGIGMEQIEEKDYKNVRYKLLNIEQYNKVYKKSVRDGYRINQRKKRDKEKLEMIDRFLNEKNQFDC